MITSKTHPYQLRLTAKQRQRLISAVDYASRVTFDNVRAKDWKRLSQSIKLQWKKEIHIDLKTTR